MVSGKTFPRRRVARESSALSRHDGDKVRQSKQKKSATPRIPTLGRW
jgi:hypothetical protein